MIQIILLGWWSYQDIWYAIIRPIIQSSAAVGLGGGLPVLINKCQQSTFCLLLYFPSWKIFAERQAAIFLQSIFWRAQLAHISLIESAENLHSGKGRHLPSSSRDREYEVSITLHLKLSFIMHIFAQRNSSILDLDDSFPGSGIAFDF